MSNKIKLFMEDLSFIKEICVEHKYNSEENSFQVSKYDEFSGKIWLENNKIFHEFQDKRYCIQVQDDKNCNVYYASLDEETFDFNKDQKKIDALIKDGSKKIVDYTLFDIKSSKVESYDNSQKKVDYLIDQIYNVTLHVEDRIGIRKDRIEVRSYDYQKNYYNHVLNQTEEKDYEFSDFKFLKEVFLNSGGGFLYDEKKGSFFYHSTQYIENLSPAINHPLKLKLNHCSYSKFTYLNEEWLEGLKKLMSLLKVNSISIEDPKDVERISLNLSEAYKYFQEKIDILEPKINKDVEISDKMKQPEIMYKMNNNWEVFFGHGCNSQKEMEDYVKELDPYNNNFKVVDLDQKEEKIPKKNKM